MKWRRLQDQEDQLHFDLPQNEEDREVDAPKMKQLQVLTFLKCLSNNTFLSDLIQKVHANEVFECQPSNRVGLQI